MNNPEAIVTVDGIQIYTTKEELKEAVVWCEEENKKRQESVDKLNKEKEEKSKGRKDPLSHHGYFTKQTATIQDFYRYKYLSNK